MKNITAYLSGAVLATALFLASERAKAATVVLFPPGNFAALGINNLAVDGVTYDVTFAFIAPPALGETTFAGNAAGALDAANAMITALNGSTAVNITDGTANDNVFGVQISSLSNGATGPLVENNLATLGGWVLLCADCTSVGDSQHPLSLAIFGVVTTTPLPAALPLFATGLGCLGLLGWRRKRKAQAVAFGDVT